ncbi:MAG: hypothetical protein HY241_06795 [Actinobacteria bacterium]|nr:hypothetical protein [Actinomycetota bacterium]
MSWLRLRWLPLAVLVAATATLFASIAWTAGGATAWPTSGIVAPVAPVDGPVRDLDDAERAAERFAEQWGLGVGEVMRFDNGFYAELVDSAGNGATEVLIDPQSGAVGLEWGPAMMWNTGQGMHRGRGHGGGYSVGATISPDQARRIADAWLRANRPGEHADQAEAFPGYYTLHTLRGDRVAGMLSVHATSGAVWYHSWHGRFIDMLDHSDAG